MQDWHEIYSRELIEQPPADVFVSAYFGYEPPAIAGGDADEDLSEIVFDVSDCEA